MNLSFTHYRCYSSLENMPAFERKQYYAGTTYQKNTQANTDEIDALLMQLFDEGNEIEFIDVLDEHGALMYQWITDIDGGATLHSNGTTDCLAKACQHSLERCTTKELWIELSEAQRRFGKLKNNIDFTIDDDCDHCFKVINNQSE